MEARRWEGLPQGIRATALEAPLRSVRRQLAVKAPLQFAVEAPLRSVRGGGGRGGGARSLRPQAVGAAEQASSRHTAERPRNGIATDGARRDGGASQQQAHGAG
jgi:hypothetical protein